MLTLKLAWRDFLGDKLLWGLSASAVAIGVAVVISGDIVKGALLRALSNSDEAQMLWSGMTEQLDSNLTAIGIAITLAAGFVVFNAFSISVVRRRRRLATLRSIGMTRAQLLRLAMVEALFTAIVGVALGLFAGPLLGRLTIAAITTVLAEGMLVFELGPPAPEAMTRAAVFGFSISVLAALVPALQASRVSPLAARRPVEAQGIESSRAWSGWAALGVMALVILYLRMAPPGAVTQPPWDVRAALLFGAGWLALALLVVAAAAGVVGGWLRRPLRRVAGASGVLMADNLRRARRRVSLTVLSLALALALVVGLSGFTRFTFQSLMRPIVERAGSLGAWAVTSFDVLEGMSAYTELEQLNLNPEDVEAVRGVVGDRAEVVEFRYVSAPELSFFGSGFFSYLLTPEEVSKSSDLMFQFEEGDLESAITTMERGCGALVMPGVANEMGAGLGDTVQVTAAGGPVECTLAGIGTSLFTGSVIGTTDMEIFEPGGSMVAMVTPKSGADRLALEADLETLAPGLSVTAFEEVTEATNELVKQMPIVLNGMAVLAVLAAALGVLNTLTASVVERRGEFGLFRAVGATRRQLRSVVTGEAALMAGLGAAIGILAGLGITIIVPTVYGGSSWGISDLDHWAAAEDALRPAIVIGLFGWLAAVLIGGVAGLLTAQSMLRRRRLVGELQAEGH